jgi:hypothetical protein
VCLDASVDAVHADAPEEHGRGHDVVDELRDRIAYLERRSKRSATPDGAPTPC